MEGGGGLPDIPSELHGFERRRDRRPRGNYTEGGLHRLSRRRHRLAEPGLSLAQQRQRIRHQRLRGGHGGLRHDGRLKPPRLGPSRAGDPPGHGSRRQPQLGRAPLVQGIAILEGIAEARLVHMEARPSRRSPQQLEGLLRRERLGVRLRYRRVLSPPLRPRPTRPQLGKSRATEGGLRHDAALVRARHRRLPDGRRDLVLEGSLLPRPRAGGGDVLPDGAIRLRPPAPRFHPRDAQGGLRRLRRHGGGRGARIDGR